MTLEIRFVRIRTGRWGWWPSGPELPSQMDSRLGVPGGTSSPDAVLSLPQGRRATLWELDPGGWNGHQRGRRPAPPSSLHGLRGDDTERARYHFDLPAASLWWQHGLQGTDRG